MAAKSGSRRGLLKARSEDNASSSHFDAEEGDSDSEEEEDATKPGARHFGLWVIAALLCAILAMFCAVYGLSLKDSGTSGEDAGEGSGMRPEDEDTEHMPESGLLTNAEFRWFKWTPLKRTAEESILDAFRFGMGWANARFTEGREGPAQAMTKEYVADWVANQLLRVNPFGKDDAVPVPLSPLKQGHFVGYTRRQVCYIVAQSLLGARTEGYDSFLARYLDGEDECGADSAEPSPRTDSFGRALWNLLATCAADPSLSGVGHGPLLLVVVAEKVEEKVTKLKQIASYAPLEGAGLRVCRYDDGATDLADPIYSKGEEDVPQEGCIPPTLGGPGRDFLTGGLRYQAVLATAFGESLPCGSRSERDPLLAYIRGGGTPAISLRRRQGAHVRQAVLAAGRAKDHGWPRRDGEVRLSDGARHEPVDEQRLGDGDSQWDELQNELVAPPARVHWGKPRFPEHQWEG
ncbi:unnamed protein product [Prorocentrum cordatum]|uniref:Uncharacterized protein n=1 Tax=Prorocentrum cordatum TaxID=2364126 RepID=A0ABN9T5H5_9DINO|nr:unnamed protein product [Polarella glacialis]